MPGKPSLEQSQAVPQEGRRRVVIDRLSPSVDGGSYPVKRELGEQLRITAELVSDGHEPTAGALLYRHADDDEWQEQPLVAFGNDVYRSSFELERLGTYYFTVEAWTDRFSAWRHGLDRKWAAGQDIRNELLMGAALVDAAAARSKESDGLRKHAALLRDERVPIEIRVASALDSELSMLMSACPDRSLATRLDPPRAVTVDRTIARFGSWYEFFPRSAGPAGSHGTLLDACKRLDYVASMGFDIVYLPPIHPIGFTHRKGRNNSVSAQPGDPGSPWAIGGPDGGHQAIHSELGTLADFAALMTRARALGIELALDIAFQASPDHPWVKEHPEWFVHRPDGTIQYAENPPKKYQDVYPFDFDTPAWPALWQALRGVFTFWIEQGIRIFRVDNPHTKPLPFWQWCIGSLKREHPDLIFLAEAFTRPRLMKALAKLGFSQSYTYFTWRNTAAELTTYMQELLHDEVPDFLRPNFWPNTPDILPQALQFGGRAAFIARLVLAATLSANYGIYGPAYELMQSAARPESEEYLDSEKYEIKPIDPHSGVGLQYLIRRINQIRREHRALQRNSGLVFHCTDNQNVLCYSKRAGEDVILVAVNLDYHHSQNAWLDLDREALGISQDEAFQAHDVLSGARYMWRGARSYVELQPEVMPAQIFHLKRLVRSEQNFEYYL